MTAVIAGCVKPVSMPMTPAAIPPATATPAPPPSTRPTRMIQRTITSRKPARSMMPINISTPAISAMTGLRPLTTNEVMVTTSFPPVSGNPATTAAMAEPMMAVM